MGFGQVPGIEAMSGNSVRTESSGAGIQNNILFSPKFAFQIVAIHGCKISDRSNPWMQDSEQSMDAIQCISDRSNPWMQDLSQKII